MPSDTFLNALRHRFRPSRVRNQSRASQSSQISFVDDPESPMRLIRVDGAVGAGEIDRLVESWGSLSAPYALHLDLSDAHIEDSATIQRLEVALDDLEHHRIDVRIVGLDPNHPGLDDHSAGDCHTPCS